MKARLVLALVSAVAVLGIAGCGGGGGSSTDPASVAPPSSPLFVEATVRPQGQQRSDLEALARNVAGVDDLGGLIVSKLESSARESGANVDYSRDIAPWLGEKAGIFFEHYDGSNFSDVGGVFQTTDTAAAQDFIDKLAKTNDHPVRSASYSGVDYEVDTSDDSALGVVGDFVVFGDSERAFKDAVDAFKGDSLADQDRYTSTVSAAPGGSIADVYADIGGLIRQSGTSASDQNLKILKSLGLDPTDSTALASVVPGSDQVEIDLSTDLGAENVATGGGADLLESFSGNAVAAFAASNFGAQLKQALDGLDASGIPPDVPPHKLKSTLKQAGVDLDKIVGSIGDAGLFVEGTSMKSLDGALVLTMSDANTATETVANVGMFLRRAGVPGVTAVSGQASGFSVRSRQLGRNPIVVVAKGDRVAIGYGLAAALQGLSPSAGAKLADSPTYKAAVDSLGGAPISGFVDGPSALRLAEALGASGPKFEATKPYLSKVRFLALGTGKQGDLATTKVIVGFDR